MNRPWAVAVLLASIAVATARAEPVKLTVAYAFPGIMRPPLEEIAKRFMAQNNDIVIEFAAPATDYEDLTQRTLRAALTGDAPDVILHGYHRVRIAATRGGAVPLDNLAGKDLEAQGYPRPARALCEVDGRLYGLPFATSTQIVYYNADLVRRAGADPDRLPPTWPEIIALAKKIRALDAGVSSIFFDYKGAGNWGFLALVQSHGGRMMSDDERDIQLNGPAGMIALKLLSAFGDAGQVDMSRAQAQQAFSAGSIGIFVYTSSALTAIEKQVGGRFDIRTSTFPISAAGGTIPAGGACAMVFANADARKKAAWEFIKFAGGPVGQTLSVTMSGYMPNNTIAVERADLLGDFYKQKPNHMTSVRQLPVMSSFWTWPGENSIKIQDVIENHLVAVATRKTSPETAMEAMVRDVKALLPN